MRQKETTGAPVRSDPKVGNACAWRPSRNAATDSSSAAVTTPWPAAAVDANFEHSVSFPPAAGPGLRSFPRAVAATYPIMGCCAA